MATPTITAVVDATTYGAVYEDSILAVFGHDFSGTGDVVIVSPSGQTLGPASGYWYDSSGQINGQPGSLLPVGPATLRVRVASGASSNDWPILILARP